MFVGNIQFRKKVFIISMVLILTHEGLLPDVLHITGCSRVP